MNIENAKRDPRKAGNICNKFQINLKLPFLTGPRGGVEYFWLAPRTFKCYESWLLGWFMRVNTSNSQERRLGTEFFVLRGDL